MFKIWNRFQKQLVNLKLVIYLTLMGMARMLEMLGEERYYSSLKVIFGNVFLILLLHTRSNMRMRGGYI